MKERPILFSAPMVRAILSGRKTVTRRIVKPQPPKNEDHFGSDFGLSRAVADGVKMYSQNDYDRLPKHPTEWEIVGSVGVARDAGYPSRYRCPFGEAGDRLWVKETFQPFWADSEICPENRWKDGPEGYRINYVADSGPEPYEHEDDLRLTPSIYMPRWASRITLEVVSVRVERLHEITAEDVCREGVEGDELESFPPQGDRKAFAKLWDAINAKRAPWVENPWVWRVEFKRVT